MKIYFECLECGTKKTAERIEKSTKDEKLRIKCAKAFLRLMEKEFKESACPSNVGTLQVNLIKKITGCKDPFIKDKATARKNIEKFAKKIEKYIGGMRDQKKRFIEACRFTALANITEIMAPINFGIKNESDFSATFGIDDSERLYEMAKRAKRILFLTDNYAEALFDLIFLKELKKVTNAKLVIGASKEPVDDDLTLDDAKKIFKEIECKFKNTGNSFGIWWERAPKGILKEIKKCDLIIAKGLAAYETLTERDVSKGKTFFLFVAKCKPISKELGVDLGKGVIYYYS
jgi:uncharacterized protein with ATP-grasp and redox domains